MEYVEYKRAVENLVKGANCCFGDENGGVRRNGFERGDKKEHIGESII